MIILKSPDEIEKMAEAGRIVARTLAYLEKWIAPGISTAELDTIAEEFIHRQGGVPAFKGYRDYPCTLCTSVNDEVVHGIPSKKKILREGDIIGVDVGAIVEGYYGDAAVTFAVGRIPEEDRRLLQVTREALYKGIERAVPGNRLTDISHEIQRHAEASGYSVVREFVGHGIGRNLHEDPQVPNFGEPGQGPRLKEGMVLAIEPMVNAGGPEVRVLQDGWTVVTRDGGRSAHFEHTIVITARGAKILTQL